MLVTRQSVGEREREPFSSQASSIPKLCLQHPRPQVGSRKPGEEAPAAAARALGCPHQFPLPLGDLLALRSEAGEPQSLSAARGDAWALLPSLEPQVGTRTLGTQEWREQDRTECWVVPSGPLAAQVLTVPLFCPGPTSPAPRTGPRGELCDASPSSPGGPSSPRLSHQPVPEGLLTAASHLVRKGHAEGGGKDGARATARWPPATGTLPSGQHTCHHLRRPVRACARVGCGGR